MQQLQQLQQRRREKPALQMVFKAAQKIQARWRGVQVLALLALLVQKYKY